MGMMTMTGSLIGGGLVGMLVNQIQIMGCYVLLMIVVLVSVVATTITYVGSVPPMNQPHLTSSREGLYYEPLLELNEFYHCLSHL